MGLGGKEEVAVGSAGNFLTAIEPTTGKIAWRRPFPGAGDGGGGGLLTTAGKLIFAGDAGGNLVAYDAVTGKPLWNSRIGNVSNAPITYMLDGRQHIVVAVGDTLYAFALYE
jgi:alcohol dehydrogenase (cytochrome c)